MVTPSKSISTSYHYFEIATSTFSTLAQKVSTVCKKIFIEIAKHPYSSLLLVVGAGLLFYKYALPLIRKHLFIKNHPISWRIKKHGGNVNQPLALEKMVKNANKAIEEHYNHYNNTATEKNPSQNLVFSNTKISEDHEKYCKTDNNPYPNPENLQLTINLEDLTKKQPRSLKIECFSHTAQNYRSSMEDAHFDSRMPGGEFLAGVFDGHSGSNVSDYAADNFKSNFQEALKITGNVHYAFEFAVDTLQEKILKKSYFGNQGSCAVISYIDAKTHLIYTATIGDCEANIYRKNSQKKMESIPLSCVRDWLSDKDLSRLKEHNGPATVDAFIKHWKDTGYEHSPFFSTYIGAKISSKTNSSGPNQSRAFGYKNIQGATPKKDSSPLIISKPKITIQKLLPNDIIVLASGLKDYCFENKIIETIQEPSSPSSEDNDEKSSSPSFKAELATTLGEKAKENMGKKNRDNTTVITIHVS